MQETASKILLPHLGITENRLDVIHWGTAKNTKLYTTLLEFLNPKRAHRHKGFIITNKDLSDTQKSFETKMAQIAIEGQAILITCYKAITQVTYTNFF